MGACTVSLRIKSASLIVTLLQLAYLVITLADVAGVFHSNLTYMGPAGMLGTLMPAIAVRSGLGFFVCPRSTDCSQQGSVPHAGGASIDHSEFADTLRVYQLGKRRLHPRRYCQCLRKGFLFQEWSLAGEEGFSLRSSSPRHLVINDVVPPRL